MSVTRALASNLSRIKYDDLPLAVVEKSKLLVLDTMGNSIGGYRLNLSTVFLDLSKRWGVRARKRPSLETAPRYPCLWRPSVMERCPPCSTS